MNIRDPAILEKLSESTWRELRGNIDYKLQKKKNPEIINTHKRWIKALVEFDFDLDRAKLSINTQYSFSDLPDGGEFFRRLRDTLRLTMQRNSRRWD